MKGSANRARWILRPKRSESESIDAVLSIIEEGNEPKRQKCQHLMFLYDSKSGGQKVLSLLKYFRTYTSLIYDAFKLNTSDTDLHQLSNDLQRYEGKLIVCIVGGDDTQCRPVTVIDKAIQISYSKRISFPVIIPFPVGTGNDLSRCLGWGHTERPPKKIIKQIADAQFCYNHSKRFDLLDRWSIGYTFDGVKDTKQYIKCFDPPLPETFLCDLSFGCDAMMAYNANVQRAMNSKYFEMGLEEIDGTNPISHCVELQIDEKSKEIPSNAYSLRVANNSAQGVFPWGECQTKKEPKLNDGLLEVMATKASKQCTATRLGQSSDIQIRVTKTPICLQIDGNAWLIDTKCILDIKLHDQLPTLIGYKFPRGVSDKYQNESYTEKTNSTRHRFRDVMKKVYPDQSMGHHHQDNKDDNLADFLVKSSKTLKRQTEKIKELRHKINIAQRK